MVRSHFNPAPVLAAKLDEIFSVVMSDSSTLFVGFILRSPILCVENPLWCQNDRKISWCKTCFSRLISLCSVEESFGLEGSFCQSAFFFPCIHTHPFCSFVLFQCSNQENCIYVMLKMYESKQQFTTFSVFLIIK